MAIRYSSSGGTPFGDTSGRPNPASVGQTYYNGQLGYLEIYTVSGWIPATGANDFSLNITGLHTTVTFSQTYSSGSYSIVSFLNDAAIDIYAFASDGSLAGYTNTKAFTATQRFNKMVVIGGSAGDVLQFSYKTTYATSLSTTDTTAGPYITSITPSGVPNQNDTVTITGGNFATDVAVTFTGTGYSATNAKSIVRSSSTSLIVTRPDNLPPSGSPYTITVSNPGVTSPTGSNYHIYSAITTGSVPIWNTSQTLPTFTKNSSYSTTVSASDPDGASITYSVVSGTLPTGLTFNASTATISGTPTSSTTTTYTIRATDAGGNYVDRTFTIPNVGPTWVTSGNILSYIQNSAYSYQLSATDDSGIAPTYSIASGTLPTGLSLSSSGLISGISSVATTNTLTFNATDANGNVATSSSITITPAPIVTGGTLTSDSTYYYRTFTGNSNLVVSNANISSVDVMIIAGGGAGGGNAPINGYHMGGGGGGAGGFRVINSSAPVGTYNIAVGGGGTTSSYISTSGTSSSAFSFSSAGGGNGAYNGPSNAVAASSGGSGGGAGRDATALASGNTPSTTPSQGNNGGAYNSNNAGAGGGGAGAVGADSSSNTPGNGGAGTNAYSSWLTAISSAMTGVSGWSTATSTGYIAGGGGGGAGNGNTGTSTGGAGGGASQTSYGGSNGIAAIQNTGGGGSGSSAHNNPNGYLGGTGGSGLIVVRYTKASVGG